MIRGADVPWVVRCPAKVNLSLRVLGRRDDGYHELDTVFQAIGLWDRIEGRHADRLSLSCDNPALPVDARNLVFRAAQMLAERAGVPARADLRLFKSIPAQAGLGGGSSDAAGALVLCSRLWNLDLEAAEMAEIAAALGADVPFFLVGGTARGTSRGDRISPLAPLAETWLLLGFPPFGIATAEVFASLAGRLTRPGEGVSVSPRFPLAVNDLEGVVFERWPELRRFRDGLLEAGADGALLSGSGSTTYGIFGSQRAADRAAEALRGVFSDWTLVPAMTVSEGIGWVSSP